MMIVKNNSRWYPEVRLHLPADRETRIRFWLTTFRQLGYEPIFIADFRWLGRDRYRAGISLPIANYPVKQGPAHILFSEFYHLTEFTGLNPDRTNHTYTKRMQKITDEELSTYLIRLRDTATKLGIPTSHTAGTLYNYTKNTNWHKRKSTPRYTYEQCLHLAHYNIIPGFFKHITKHRIPYQVVQERYTNLTDLINRQVPLSLILDLHPEFAPKKP